MVSAPLLPIALSKPYSAMRSTSPTVVGIGPAAAKAMSGLVAAKMKSVCSKMSAIRSLTSIRNISVVPARLHVEVVGGQVHAQLDLRGEIVVAGRVAVAERRRPGRSGWTWPTRGRPRGSSTTTSTRVEAGARRSGPRPPRSPARPTSGSTMADPRSIEITARLPARSKVSRPASQPSTRGRLRVSRGSKPLHTSNQRAVSRTERDTHPTTTVRGGWSAAGPLGMRPKVDLSPNRPVKPAGMRMEPPPSPPLAMGRRPPATAAADPPEDPPGVRSGIPRVAGGPVELGRGAVDAAELGGRGLAGQDRPGGPEPGHLGGVVVGDPVLEDQRGLGVGPPVDRLELLHPDGDPAEGEGDVGRCGRGPGRVGIEVAEGVEPRGLDGGQRCLEGLGGADGPGPEGVDERAGVSEPGLIGHGPDATGNGRRAAGAEPAVAVRRRSGLQRGDRACHGTIVGLA